MYFVFNLNTVEWHWNGLLCADVPLRNCSLTHSLTPSDSLGLILSVHHVLIITTKTSTPTTVDDWLQCEVVWSMFLKLRYFPINSSELISPLLTNVNHTRKVPTLLKYWNIFHEIRPTSHAKNARFNNSIADNTCTALCLGIWGGTYNIIILRNSYHINRCAVLLPVAHTSNYTECYYMCERKFVAVSTDRCQRLIANLQCTTSRIA